MKNQVGRVFASLLLSVLMLGSALHAQRTERVIKANIPFDFVVGREIFPAGQYSVALIGPVLLELRDSRGRALINVLTQSVQAPAKPGRPKLRFDNEEARTSSPRSGKKGMRLASRSCAQSQPLLLSEEARDTSKLPRRAIRVRRLTIAITKWGFHEYRNERKQRTIASG